MKTLLFLIEPGADLADLSSESIFTQKRAHGHSVAPKYLQVECYVRLTPLKLNLYTQIREL